RKCQMCEWREIATGTDRAFFWNDRMHVAVQHLTKHCNDLWANTAEAEREHVCAQQHHCANFGLRKRFTDSAGVAANKIELELAQCLARNANVREFTKTRRYTVNHGVTRNDFFDNFARCENTRLRERGNLNCLPIKRHGGNVGECQCLAV